MNNHTFTLIHWFGPFTLDEVMESNWGNYLAQKEVSDVISWDKELWRYGDLEIYCEDSDDE